MSKLLCLIGCLMVVSQANAFSDEGGASDILRFGKLAAGKVLVLGNSITIHDPAQEIGWHGNWGMAASSAEKDFAHLLAARIGRETGKQPELRVKNIASFERGYTEFDLQKELKSELEFKPDIVILAIGENVTAPETDSAKQAFARSCEKLIETIRENGRPAIFVRSSFWANPIKDDILKSACEKTDAIYIDISHLGAIEANAAKSERKFDHDGVAAHPGDAGMQAIADAIFEAVERVSKQMDEKK
jgi:lysophospholipase L1-like esterase